jgi:hypothetical protein
MPPTSRCLAIEDRRGDEAEVVATDADLRAVHATQVGEEGRLVLGTHVELVDALADKAFGGEAREHGAQGRLRVLEHADHGAVHEHDPPVLVGDHRGARGAVERMAQSEVFRRFGALVLDLRAQLVAHVGQARHQAGGIAGRHRDGDGELARGDLAGRPGGDGWVAADGAQQHARRPPHEGGEHEQSTDEQPADLPRRALPGDGCRVGGRGSGPFDGAAGGLHAGGELVVGGIEAGEVRGGIATLHLHPQALRRRDVAIQGRPHRRHRARGRGVERQGGVLVDHALEPGHMLVESGARAGELVLVAEGPGMEGLVEVGLDSVVHHVGLELVAQGLRVDGLCIDEVTEVRLYAEAHEAHDQCTEDAADAEQQEPPAEVQSKGHGGLTNGSTGRWSGRGRVCGCSAPPIRRSPIACCC